MSIVNIPADVDTDGLTRQEVQALARYDHEREDEFCDALNELYGTVSIAGYDWDAGEALRRVSPGTFRSEFADWDSANYQEVDPYDYPEDPESGEQR